MRTKSASIPIPNSSPNSIAISRDDMDSWREDTLPDTPRTFHKLRNGRSIPTRHRSKQDSNYGRNVKGSSRDKAKLTPSEYRAYFPTPNQIKEDDIYFRRLRLQCDVYMKYRKGSQDREQSDGARWPDKFEQPFWIALSFERPPIQDRGKKAVKPGGKTLGRNERISDYIERIVGREWVDFKHSPTQKDRKIISSHLQQLKKHFQYEENIDSLWLLGKSIEDIISFRQKLWVDTGHYLGMVSKWFQDLLPRPATCLTRSLESPSPMLEPQSFEMSMTRKSNKPNEEESEVLWPFTCSENPHQNTTEFLDIFHGDLSSSPLFEHLQNIDLDKCELIRASASIAFPPQTVWEAEFCICNVLRCKGNMMPSPSWWSKTTYYEDGKVADFFMEPKHVDIIDNQPQDVQVSLGSGFWVSRIPAMTNDLQKSLKKAEEGGDEVMFKSMDRVGQALRNIVAIQKIFDGRSSSFPGMFDDSNPPFMIIEWRFNLKMGHSPGEVVWNRLEADATRAETTCVDFDSPRLTNELPTTDHFNSHFNSIPLLPSQTINNEPLSFSFDTQPSDFEQSNGSTSASAASQDVCLTTELSFQGGSNRLHPSIRVNSFDDANLQPFLSFESDSHRHAPSSMGASDHIAQPQPHLFAAPTLLSNTIEEIRSAYQTPPSTFGEEDLTDATTISHDQSNATSQTLIDEGIAQPGALVPLSIPTSFSYPYEYSPSHTQPLLDQSSPLRHHQQQQPLSMFPRYPTCSPSFYTNNKRPTSTTDLIQHSQPPPIEDAIPHPFSFHDAEDDFPTHPISTFPFQFPAAPSTTAALQTPTAHLHPLHPVSPHTPRPSPVHDLSAHPRHFPIFPEAFTAAGSPHAPLSTQSEVHSTVVLQQNGDGQESTPDTVVAAPVSAASHLQDRHLGHSDDTPSAANTNTNISAERDANHKTRDDAAHRQLPASFDPTLFAQLSALGSGSSSSYEVQHSQAGAAEAQLQTRRGHGHGHEREEAGGVGGAEEGGDGVAGSAGAGTGVGTGSGGASDAKRSVTLLPSAIEG